ncbi:MAG: ATP-dependent DNA ligase [Chloroflexi bacterium]|nr:MAG: ATP-dependent DNA ligase [Chloroflexota bacterium]
MRRWSELAERVASTTRTSEKTGLLADYLRTLDADELPIAVVFLTGRPFPEADQRATGIGWATIANAIGRVSGADRSDLAAAYDRFSDISAAVGDVLAKAGHAPDEAASPSLVEVAATFAAIEAASGPARKAELLASLLARSDPKTARGIVRVLSGELRIGLREGLVEAALAKAFDRPLDAVKRAGMLTGDIGRTAELAKAGRLEGAELALFHPLKFMLASPAEDAAEILARLGPTVWVEDKYDGIRCQLHRLGDEVRLYSRDLHDISAQFPEVVAAARDLPWDGILDGELLAWRDGTVLPFIALQSRLGRRDPPKALLEEVPVIYVAFDVLGLGQPALTMTSTNGTDRAAASPTSGGRADVVGGPDSDPGTVAPLLEVPLTERRHQLERLGLPLAEDGGSFALSHLTTADSTDALEAVFAEARARRNEGLMVKDPTSIYSPGRRGYGWLKMKKALATIDCVVVGVEVGHGKRHGVLSDYTFAVRDEARDQLVTIGKAYSGLTDAEIATMTRWFEEHTISQHGRYRVVEPTVVVEVAFDVILRSNRHKSGFALRFPRIARLRVDKDPREADTLETVTRLYEGLQSGAEHLVTAGVRREVG